MSFTLSDPAIVKHEVESLIEDYFAESSKSAHEINLHYATLWSSIDKLFHAGGKRMRPIILVLAYEAFGGQRTNDIYPIAAAQELLHTAMLIHDDIIDRDEMRSGVLNITGQYNNAIYLPLVTAANDRRHYADGAAILAGDLLIAGAFRMILASKTEPQIKLSAYERLYTSIFDVAGGELLDIETAFRDKSSIDILAIAHYKTASYSFIGPLLTGAEIAGAEKKQLNRLKEYAIALGIAYQLADDLLGTFGDPSLTGKSTNGDIREGKYTMLAKYTEGRLSDAQRVEFDQYFGSSNATETNIQRVRELMILSGAKKEVSELIDNYTQQALGALGKMSLSIEARKRFEQLVKHATKRDS